MLNEQYEKWNRSAPLGFVIIGLGLALTGNAMASKNRSGAWFIKSILGVLILSLGLALFGEGLKARSLYETELDKLKKDA